MVSVDVDTASLGRSVAKHLDRPLSGYISDFTFNLAIARHLLAAVTPDPVRPCE
jgi:hypothetical protein